MKAMQMNLSQLVKQPNRSFASVLLAFSLFRFLRPHHANSANARYLCESGEIELAAKTGAIAAEPFSAMKIWVNELLQNTAFPAVVLAFACSLINNEIPVVRTDRFTDHHRAAKMQIRYIDPMNREGWYQPTKSPAFQQDPGT